MGKITDLVGLSKSLTKLMDVVSQGVGRATKTYFTKRDADATAYEISTISKALRENTDLGIQYTSKNISINTDKNANELSEQSLAERVLTRVSFQEAKKQLNLENVIQVAADELNNEETVSSEKVNDDWINRFFKLAEDVSDEKMQVLWGKILAGEVKTPNSFSMRTLDSLKNLSQEEALVLIKFSKIALKSNTVAFFLEDVNLTDYGIPYKEHLLMEELGFVNATASGFKFKLETGREAAISYGNLGILIEGNKGVEIQISTIFTFTTIGKQLLNLIDKPSPDMSYLTKLATEIKRHDVIVRCANIISESDGHFTVDHSTEIIL